MQVALLAGLWALVTWAGVGGIAFPVPIMALVPLRRYLLPRWVCISMIKGVCGAKTHAAHHGAGGGAEVPAAQVAVYKGVW